MHCTWMFLLGSVSLPCFLAYERGYCTINLEEPATQAFDKIQIKKGIHVTATAVAVSGLHWRSTFDFSGVDYID